MPQRRLGLVQCVSLNMSMMVGVGPFITIPLLLRSMDGPVALWAWVFGAVVAVCDGLVWSELAGAFPGAGGTYHFYDAALGETRLGRASKFLFVWQFLASAPLELASGMIGIAAYGGYVLPALKIPVWTLSADVVGRELVWSVTRGQLAAAAATFGIVALAYRRIASAGRLMVALWLGMLATVLWITVEGLARFDPKLAFDVPPESLRFDLDLVLGAGTALSLAMYAYFGYYQVCYLGDEVEEPRRTIPRSILISVAAVAAIYLSMSLGIVGAMPWRDAAESSHVASDFLEPIRGAAAAKLAAWMVIWTAVAACYAALLGASRVPYAAAKAGHFLPAFAKLHPTGDFPHLSLLLIGGLTSVACLAELDLVIASLMTTRILVQFVGQIALVVHVRRRTDLRGRTTFRMPWYPLPAVVALLGWTLVFATSGRSALAVGLGSLALGGACFAAWDRRPAGEDAG